MSMLAERKIKQKWSLNPRGNDWSQNDNKLGQKMLEKMGWTKGKGLGLKEDGNPDHVKVSAKSNAFGLGYQENQEAWTQHEDNFASLLESLSSTNDEHIIRTSEPSTSQSLEEKSKQSRARVHYSKFTRGKDISKYSAKDLANIFGKTHLELPPPVEILAEPSVLCNDSEAPLEHCKKKKKKKKKLQSESKENTSPKLTDTVTDCVVVLNRIDETKYDRTKSKKHKPKKEKKKKPACFLMNILKQKRSKKTSTSCLKEPSGNLMRVEFVAFNSVDCQKKEYDNLALDASDETTGKRKSHVLEDMEVIRSDKPQKKKRKTQGIDNPSLDITPPEPCITSEGFDNPCLDVSEESFPKAKKNRTRKSALKKRDLDISESKTKKRVRFAKTISEMYRYEKTSMIGLVTPFEKAVDNVQSEIENSINETKSEQETIVSGTKEQRKEMFKKIAENPDVVEFPGIQLVDVIGYGQNKDR